MKRDAAGDSQKVDMTAPVTMATQEHKDKPTGDSEKVAMTAPVAMQLQQQQQEAQEGKQVQTTMAFIAPSKFKSVTELPVPKDSRVTLTEVPQR